MAELLQRAADDRRPSRQIRPHPQGLWFRLALHRRHTWAGLGACLLAWCGSRRPFPAWLWAVRLGCGFGAMYVALFLFRHLPEVFLPLYSTLKAQYQDFQSNPNLRRLVNDNRAAIAHLGLYLGFLLFEVGRRDWKNVKLILTVGLLNGLGWALCQNWQWAARVWPEAQFNFWRCWESSGGISIGIAYGVAFYLANNRMPEPELAAQGSGSDPEPRTAGGLFRTFARPGSLYQERPERLVQHLHRK